MKNKEIKEILKEIESYENEECCLIVLSQKQNKTLLNYITNLQKRIEKAVEYIKNDDIDVCTIRYNDIYDTKKELLNILNGDD